MSKKLNYIIPFDEKCNEIKIQDKLVSELLLKEVSDNNITDVFVVSHGWLNNLNRAKESYRDWLSAMEKQIPTQQLPSEFQPLVIGIHWPSDPCADDELDTLDNVSFGMATEPSIEELIESYAKRIAETEAARQALKKIFEATMAMEHDNPPPQLPPEIKKSYDVLGKEAGFGYDGVSGAPGSDREPFDPESIYQAAIKDSKTKSVSFGFLDTVTRWGCSFPLLAPMKNMSFWKMKDRARKIGENAVFPLLKKFQKANNNIRLHLMGHSFGCIVVSAAIAGPKNGDNTLVNPISSVSLLQGALSLWSYCPSIPEEYCSDNKSSGYFNSIIANRKIAGPLITTQSEHDDAVGIMYPPAVVADEVNYSITDNLKKRIKKYGAVGSYGLQGQGLEIVEDKMHTKDQPYSFEPGKIYNLESSEFICNKEFGGFGSGAHSDIAKPEVAHAVWSAVLSGIKASQQPAKIAPSFSIEPDPNAHSVNKGESMASQELLIQSLEQFVESQNKQIAQLRAKLLSAQGLLDEMKRY